MTDAVALTARRARPMPSTAMEVATHGRITPVLVLLYTMVLPPEFEIELGGVTFFPYRLVMLLLLPWLIYRYAREGIKPHKVDLLAALAAVWIIISMAYHYGASAIVSGGGLVLDLIIPYFLARYCIRSLDDISRTLRAFLPGLGFIALVVFLESVSARQIIRPFAALLLEDSSAEMASTTGLLEYRMGLLRAAGPFPHPILAGAFLAGMVPLYLGLGKRFKPQIVLGIAFGLIGLFSLSSTAFVVLIVGGAVLVFDEVQERIAFLNWSKMVALIVAIGLMLELVSEGGLLRFIIRNGTLNPQTGYYRLLIWNFGTASVERNPIMGIGLEEYQRLFWMPRTVDHHWLLMAMRFGLPGAVCYYGAYAMAIISLALRIKACRGPAHAFRLSICASLVAMIFAGFTVAYFGQFQIWAALMLGFAVAASLPGQPMASPANPISSKEPSAITKASNIRARGAN